MLKTLPGVFSRGRNARLGSAHRRLLSLTACFARGCAGGPRGAGVFGRFAPLGRPRQRCGLSRGRSCCIKAPDGVHSIQFRRLDPCALAPGCHARSLRHHGEHGSGIADDGALDLSVRIRLLPGVAVAAFRFSLSVAPHSPQLADGNDDVLLFLNPGSPGHADSAWMVRQRGLGGIRMRWCAPAIRLHGPERAGGHHQFSPPQLPGACCWHFPRERLLSQLADVDRALRRTWPTPCRCACSLGRRWR